MKYETDEAELAAYFANNHVGDMGLKSWLGSWHDYGPIRPGSSSSAPSGPDGPALAAARSMTRVEETLALLEPEHVRVLKAYYAPRGPDAWGARELGAIAGVIVAMPARVLTALRLEHDRARESEGERRARGLERVRAELRGGTSESIRAELELVTLDVADPFDPESTLRALFAGGRGVRRVRERVTAAAAAARRDAQAAYRAAGEVRRERAREGRLERFRRSLVGARS